MGAAARAPTSGHRPDPGDQGGPAGCCAETPPVVSGAALVSLGALALPVLLALAPAKPLGAAAALSLGLDGPLPVRAAEQGRPTFEVDTADWTILDWHRAWAADPLLGMLGGKRVSVTGFVLPGADDDGVAAFRIARILITHCTADGQILALTVRTAESDLGADEWVRVEGTLAPVDGGGGPARPAIIAERVERIDQPARPYLSP